MDTKSIKSCGSWVRIPPESPESAECPRGVPRSASRNDAPPGRGAAQNADFHAIYFAGRNILSIFAGLKTRKGERFLLTLYNFIANGC